MMKKILLVIATLLLSNIVFAQDCRWGIDHRSPRCGPRWHEEHRPVTVIYRNNDNWVAPLIIGSIAGAVIANTTRSPAVVQQQNVCTEWKEIQQSDGKIYRERTCYQQ